MNGIERIENERRRQVESEGWTPDHDDTHADGALAMAAACYAAAACYTRIYTRDDAAAPDIIFADPWPCAWEDKRPKHPGQQSRLRMLEKAGALIAAEIDRLQREFACFEAQK